MIPGKYDITIPRGGTFELPIQYNDGVVDVDLQTLYSSARMQVYPAWATTQERINGTPLLELTTENGKLLFNGTTLFMRLTAEETGAITFNEAKYSLELVIDDPVADIVDPLLYGDITVIPEYTK